MPLIVVTASGGARMQEGTLALMQLAKTLAALERLRAGGVPFLSVLTDPTTGGVFASFASVGDVNIAEPDALIGFAGARVSAGTIAQELPPGFQRSEFLFEHGFIDRIVARPGLRDELGRLLELLPVRDLLDELGVRPARGRGAGLPAILVPVLARRAGGGSGEHERHRRSADRHAARELIRATPSGRASRPPGTCSRPRTLDVRRGDDRRVSSSSTATGCSATTRRWSRGLARIDGRRIVVVGQQKGDDTDENIRRNFGMPHPEGYRKAMRVMELAERFGLPVVTFVDVPGAHPGPESEERGIAEAIARSIGLMSRLRTPIVTVITGEGGSGGALAIAVGDVVVALENAVYSVISPEGCAAILWRTADEAPAAALAMKMTAADQLALGVIDVVVPEPGEGAHTDPAETARRLKPIVVDRLHALEAMPIDELLDTRYRRYRALGSYTEAELPELESPAGRGLADRLRDLLDPGRRAVGAAVPTWSRDEPPAREEV